MGRLGLDVFIHQLLDFGLWLSPIQMISPIKGVVIEMRSLLLYALLN